MAIGTSLGAYFDTEAQMHMASPPSNDNNVIDPDTTPDIGSDDSNVVPPHTHGPAVQMEISDKMDMPFPDNHNPDLDFKNRFGNLPPSGILNDLKKPTDPPLIRRLDLSSPK